MRHPPSLTKVCLIFEIAKLDEFRRLKNSRNMDSTKFLQAAPYCSVACPNCDLTQQYLVMAMVSEISMQAEFHITNGFRFECRCVAYGIKRQISCISKTSFKWFKIHISPLGENK